MNLFFTIVAIIVSTVILLYVRSTPPPDRLIAFTLGLQLGGALGNLIDRLRYGYVIDFLHLKYWAISNVADVSISLSVVLLGYHLIFRSHPENKVEPTTVPLPTPVASSENNADAANG
jgi:signal peptidase II